jgi:hypothetical protein
MSSHPIWHWRSVQVEAEGEPGRVARELPSARKIRQLFDLDGQTLVKSGHGPPRGQDQAYELVHGPK